MSTIFFNASLKMWGKIAVTHCNTPSRLVSISAVMRFFFNSFKLLIYMRHCPENITKTWNQTLGACPGQRIGQTCLTAAYNFLWGTNESFFVRIINLNERKTGLLLKSLRQYYDESWQYFLSTSSRLHYRKSWWFVKL